MKKIGTFFLIAIFLFSSCSGVSIPALSIDAKITPKILKGEASPVDLTTIIAGGPLYVNG